ncbi:MAG: hypothetical protein QNJ16_10055 [Rhodobacter sp.]|nr:hypothetical protein [Rhodobacter sp.]
MTDRSTDAMSLDTASQAKTRNDNQPRHLLWRGMITLRPVAGDNPVPDQSRLLRAIELAFDYAGQNGGIGLTQTKAFNRIFAHWMAEHSRWPEYRAEELLRLNKVLNEEDAPPAMVLHDLMIVAKLGRHVKGKFQVSKAAKDLATRRGAFFSRIAETYLFESNHARTARSEFTAPGNWDIFLNIINVEAEGGLTEAHLVKTLYGLEKRDGVFDREYHDHAGFLFTHVLRPLSWIGFLAETSDTGRRFDKTYWKTPLWRACLQLSTDDMVERPPRH